MCVPRSNALQDFIRCLLVASPGKRHSAEDSLHHEWLQVSQKLSFGSMCVEEEMYIHNGVGSGRGRVRLALYMYWHM